MAWEISAGSRTWSMAARRLIRMVASSKSMPRRTAVTDTSRCAGWIRAAFLGASEAAQSAARRVIQEWRRVASRRISSASLAISAAIRPSACPETEDFTARSPTVLAWAQRVRPRRAPIIAAMALTVCGPVTRRAVTLASSVGPMEAAPALRTAALAMREWDAARRSAHRDHAKLPPRVSR
jgi:hypothetical protein